MRIGIEVQRLYRSHKHGIEVFALELLKALQQIDKQNEYFVFVRKDKDDQCFVSSDNFQVVCFDSFSFGDWEQVGLPKKCKEYKIDLLHLTGNTAPLFISVPYVQTVHDIIYLDQLGWGGTPYQIVGNFYRRFVVPQTVKRAAKVVTVSDFERKRITERFGITNGHISTIYNGIGNPYMHKYSVAELDELKKKYQLPDEFMLFLGNTAPRKNAKNALVAFLKYNKKSDKKIKLVAPALNVASVKHYLGENTDVTLFHFPGFIDSEDLPKLYQAAKLLLFPSLSEGFGLPIIEAMAMSCPVITSNTTSMPEVAGGAALLVDPHDQDDIVEKLSVLMENEQKRQVVVQSGNNRAALFSWHQTAESYLKIYQQAQKP